MLGKRLTLFRIAGFKIQADVSWLLLAVLITWSLAGGLFPDYVPNLAPPVYVIMGIIGAVGLFASIIFHEVSHSLVARRYGMPIKEITLWIFGGVAHMEDNPPNPKAELLMAVAGPASSLLLAVVFLLLSRLGSIVDYPASIRGIIWYVGRINLILGLFNLIPAFPLDGGRVLRSLLWRFRNSLVQATRISSIIGSGFAFLLIGGGFMFLFSGSFIGGIWWVLIGFFLHNASRGSYNQLLMVQALSGKPVEKFMKTDIITVPAGISVSDLVEDYIYTHHYKLFPVVSGRQLKGCVTTREVKEIPREQWSETTVETISNACSENNTVPPDMDTGKVLSIMQRTGNSRLMVVEDGELKGIVTLKDLMHYLSMKMDLEGDRGA